MEDVGCCRCVVQSGGGVPSVAEALKLLFPVPEM